MKKNELTGIERQLVLQYLVDGNVPVTVTEVKTAVEDNEKIKSLTSGVFPVALPGEQMTVLDQGIILLQNPPEAVKTFDGKKVKVQFYFNKLGLYFETEIKKLKSGALALVIPALIKKIEETPRKKTSDLTAIIYYEKNSQFNMTCRIPENYILFAQPAWSDVEENNQLSAKNYLENAVMTCRSKGNAMGNGLHLISVCRYLAENDVENELNKNEIKSIEDRKNPPDIIYIDHERIVFAGNSKDMVFSEETDYSILLGFPIYQGPIKERTVYASFTVDNIFYNHEKRNYCAVCSYKDIKKEDVRYLEDKKA